MQPPIKEGSIIKVWVEKEPTNKKQKKQSIFYQNPLKWNCLKT